MSETFQHLRVENTAAPLSDTLPEQVFRSTPVTPSRGAGWSGSEVGPLRTALEHAQQDAAYYQREMNKAIREREAIKASLGAPDGPAAYWRREAKGALQKLGDARRSIENLQTREEQQRARAIQFSEEVDRLTQRVAELKRGIWDIWTAMDDALAFKQRLWDVWASL